MIFFLVGRYFLLYFNFQGLTSFGYRNGTFYSIKFLKTSNLLLLLFFLVVFFIYSTINSYRADEILKISRDLKISMSLQLISKFYFQFQQIISLALVVMFYRKQSDLLRFFNKCSKVFHTLKIELTLSDFILSFVIYLISQILIIVHVTLTYFDLMRPTFESFILYIMSIYSRNVAFHAIILAITFNNFIYKILKTKTEIKSTEKIKETLMIVCSLVTSFQIAYGNVLTMSFIQMIIIFLILVRVKNVHRRKRR